MVLFLHFFKLEVKKSNLEHETHCAHEVPFSREGGLKYNRNILKVFRFFDIIYELRYLCYFDGKGKPASSQFERTLHLRHLALLRIAFALLSSSGGVLSFGTQATTADKH